MLHLLNADQKANAQTIFTAILGPILCGDLSPWMRHRFTIYTPEMKQKSKQSVEAGGSAPKKMKLVTSAGKVIGCERDPINSLS